MYTTVVRMVWSVLYVSSAPFVAAGESPIRKTFQTMVCELELCLPSSDYSTRCKYHARIGHIGPPLRCLSEKSSPAMTSLESNF